ncbi:MAG: hypothetical protein JXX29_11960, partial [Deltaproteobacteria bacterium]|nr:hypothetical protein [Deltaproteobacteria bacterium]MBN2672389.1 hypothetical protein [Deltaproteobacteria bacterium]
IVWLAPSRVKIAQDYLTRKTGWSLFSGFFIFLIINMIPVVGGIFLLPASLAAAGATFLSRFGKKSRAM